MKYVLLAVNPTHFKAVKVYGLACEYCRVGIAGCKKDLIYSMAITEAALHVNMNAHSTVHSFALMTQ
jgi:hypothetical protein